VHVKLRSISIVSYRIVFVSFSPDLKPICFRNIFLHSISGFIWITFTDIGLGPDLHTGHWDFVCFSFFFSSFSGYVCAGLSWPDSAFQSTLISVIVSH